MGVRLARTPCIASVVSCDCSIDLMMSIARCLWREPTYIFHAAVYVKPSWMLVCQLQL